MDVEHEVAEAAAVEVPFVESVSETSIQRVMDPDMRGREIPRHISKEWTHGILEKVSKYGFEAFFVKSWVVALRETLFVLVSDTVHDKYHSLLCGLNRKRLPSLNHLFQPTNSSKQISTTKVIVRG